MSPTQLALVFLLAQIPPKAGPVPFKGPAVVVLLKDGCPCTRECRLQLNILAEACKGKIKFFGVVDSAGKKAETLIKEANLNFPLLPDPKALTIRTFKGHEALDLRLVGKDGKLIGSWDGLSRENVAGVSAKIYAETGITIDCDVSFFTTLPKLGCRFFL